MFLLSLLGAVFYPTIGNPSLMVLEQGYLWVFVDFFYGFEVFVFG
jgi:hypothetical protein